MRRGGQEKKGYEVNQKGESQTRALQGILTTLVDGLARDPKQRTEW